MHYKIKIKCDACERLVPFGDAKSYWWESEKRLVWICRRCRILHRALLFLAVALSSSVAIAIYLIISNR
jgi:RNase P subunit RPR2